ncbi:MAG: hypothetical protein AMJ89_05185 [candidate division Zixibacteria bacterium SM23_73]|nr:MAG: hypothetical protein AMJ89_05185 [candidate division Zixibacteria bacterium SM23_73]
MDYGGLVKRALDIMWKFKYLWIFGFFLEFGSGGGGGGGNLPDKFKEPISDFLTGPLLGALIFLLLAAFVIFIIFLILYIISQGGLIHCVWRIESGENPTLRDGWNAGVKNFWRILGITILIIVFVFAAAVMTLGPFIVLLIAVKLLGLLSAMVLIPLFMILVVTIALIDLYAKRACIIEEKGVFDSIAEGWETLQRNLGKSLIMALIGIGSTIVYVIGFLIAGLFLALPFIILGAINLFLGIALGVMVGLIYIAVASGAWGTYIDSLWTLAFLEMKKSKPAEAGL